MEKRIPHCRLAIVRSLLTAGRVRATATALSGASAFGFDFDDVVAIVRSLEPEDFHKSMTTHADHRIWQDVYRPVTVAGPVYLKLTVIDEVLVVSFKEL
jgi:motility quorum-sensing regulator/GCU-specific mRNA interferase toxin